MNNIASQLVGVKSIAIGGHIRPDGDCVGSCLAMYNYIIDNWTDIKVDIYLEPIPNLFKFLKNAEKINNTYDMDMVYDLFIALDCGDSERLGIAEKYFETAHKTICIDHHISNKHFADENYIFPKASSTSELVFDLIEKDKISKEIAECIYTGIVHDTGVFQYSSTSSKTMNVAGMLMDKGINFTKIIDDTFYKKTFNQNQILGKALLDSRLFLDEKCILSVLMQEDLEKYQVATRHLEGIVSQLRVTKDVDVAVLIYETEKNEFKISMRSNEIVDVSVIASLLGGGGHIRAAGCSLKGEIKEIETLILKEIEKQLR
ncbi:DHH family phosphoesterase [Anaerosacchariphilus polymeriproducens]|uniref:Bifunctional oligoribonuclease/PAP phosphatase NrnA n=1 Tax=Anaerosacchariphilus polymeriproducens TaxID=1812858 RepID=A0A371AY06_9FIRM|nr:bifunctional oligoribonuclease/PAP phosphatase NrnA [Anaerosacchariphilus polymeriproducens]RDU24370.1 bifunctional oligoribonuclease/PAP phosphatase NrnA [Anaerosacchariphilus polymeriproducens]